MRLRAGALVLSVAAVLAAGACGLGSRTPGEKLWRKRCASCHGIDGRGNTPGYMGNVRADLLDEAWYGYGSDDAALETVTREGVFGQMPANDDLTAAEMRDLVGHLRWLRGEEAAP